MIQTSSIENKISILEKKRIRAERRARKNADYRARLKAEKRAEKSSSSRR